MKHAWQPDQVQLLITERCNLRCLHCAVPEEDSPAAHELSSEDWERFVAIVARSGVRSFVLSGGEALLRSDAVALLCHAHDHGIPQTTLVTNLSVLRSSVSAGLASAQARYANFGVQASLDGGSEATHDWMRGSGKFRVFMRNAEQLARDGGRITGINTVLHRGNVHEIDRIVELVLSLGASNWRVFPIASIGRGTEIQASSLDDDAWDAILARLAAIRASTGLDVMSMGPILAGARAARTPRPGGEVSPRVIAGPDGELFMCPPLRTLPLGSVRALALTGEWDEVVARARGLAHARCPSCEMLLLCVGVDVHEPFMAATGRSFGPPLGRRSLPVV